MDTSCPPVVFKTGEADEEWGFMRSSLWPQEPSRRSGIAAKPRLRQPRS